MSEADPDDGDLVEEDGRVAQPAAPSTETPATEARKDRLLTLRTGFIHSLPAFAPAELRRASPPTQCQPTRWPARQPKPRKRRRLVTPTGFEPVAY